MLAALHGGLHALEVTLAGGQEQRAAAGLQRRSLAMS